MHYKHVEILDNLLRNAMEERTYETAFKGTLEAMTEEEREELPTVLVSRYEILSDRLAMDLPIPTLVQAQAFVDRRLDAIDTEQWGDECDQQLEAELKALEVRSSYAIDTSRERGLS